jgi:ATP-dependent 26S proteasome regulatory subunit
MNQFTMSRSSTVNDSTCWRRYSHPVDKSTGVRSDQTVVLTSFESAKAYPQVLRRVSYFDVKTGKRVKLEASLYQILQILSVSLFEKTPILRALEAYSSQDDLYENSNQLILFDL